MNKQLAVYKEVHGVYKKQDGTGELWAFGEGVNWQPIFTNVLYIVIQKHIHVKTKLPDGQYYIVVGAFDCDENIRQQAQLLYMSLLKSKLKGAVNQLAAWNEGIRMVSQSLERNVILENIMTNVMLALPDVDRGFFTLYNAQEKCLVPVASVGLSTSIHHFKTAVGEGITGKVFQSQKAEAYTNIEANEAMANLREDNYRYLMEAIKSNKQELQKQISLAAPVTFGEHHYGVLMLHQYSRQIQGNDLVLLQAFADQAAIAIHNAELYEEITQKNDILNRQQRIHTLFTNLALENKGILQIVQTMEEMLQMNVYFVNQQTFDIIPFDPIMREVIQSVSSFQWVRTKAQLIKLREQYFYIYPVVNRQHVVGYFFVQSKSIIRGIGQTILEQASVIIALKLSNERLMLDALNAQRQDFVNQLLRSKKWYHLEQLANGFHLKLSKPYYVAIGQFHLTEQEKLFAEVQMNELLEMMKQKWGQALFYYKDEQRIVFIFQKKHIQTLDNLQQIISNWNQRSRQSFSIAVSAKHADFQTFTTAYEEAENTFHYMKNRQMKGVVSFQDLGLNKLFLNQDPKAIEQFVKTYIDPLRSIKSEASQLLQTLKIYVEQNRSVTKTSKILHIHQNTLYHRLTKIEQLLDIRLNDWNDYLNISLALHLHQFEDEKKGV